MTNRWESFKISDHGITWDGWPGRIRGSSPGPWTVYAGPWAPHWPEEPGEFPRKGWDVIHQPTSATIAPKREAATKKRNMQKTWANEGELIVSGSEAYRGNFVFLARVISRNLSISRDSEKRNTSLDSDKISGLPNHFYRTWIRLRALISLCFQFNT